MHWGRRLLITLVILLLVLSGIVGLGLAFQRDFQWQESVALPEGGSLSVQGVNGTIRYDTWDGDEILIHVTKRIRALTAGMAEWLNERTTHRIVQGPGQFHLELEPAWYHNFGLVTVEYHVLVPSGWSGEVSLHTSNGAIVALDVHGDVDLRTANGRIEVRGHEGRLRAHTSNGRVEMSRIDGELQVRTSNGAVRVEGAVLRGIGFIETSNGAVTLDAELIDDASYRVRTSNGSVTLTLYEPDVSLDLETSNGRITYDAEILTTMSDRNRLQGRIGEGSARLDVRTSNGTITLNTR